MAADFESLGSIGGAVLAVLLLLAAASGLGNLVFGRMAPGRLRAIDLMLLRVLAGLDLLGLLGVTLGQFKLLGDGRSIWLLALLSMLNVPRILQWKARQGVARPLTGLARQSPFALAGGMFIGLVTLGPALCYPLGWDDLVYHVVLPRRWMADGWPAFYPDLAYSAFPSLAEILFWLLAPLESLIAPQLLLWTCWMLGLMLLYRLLRRNLSRGSAAVLALVASTSSSMLLICHNGYVESLLFPHAAAILLVGRSRATRAGVRGPEPTAAVMLGVLGAGAGATKLTGLALTALPGLWYLFDAWRCRRRGFQGCVVYCLVAAGCCLPFYLRTWIATGNPLYPYFAQWFTADPARLEMSQFHHAIGSNFGIEGVAGFLGGPFLLAFNDYVYDGSLGWQMPLLTCLGAVGLALSRRRRRGALILPATIAAVWLYSFWFFTSQQGRFAIPAAVAITQCGGFGLHHVRRRSRRWLWGLLIGAAIISAPWSTADRYLASWLTALHFFSREDYVNAGTFDDYLPLVDAVHRYTPEDARLMLLFEHRGLYLPRQQLIGTPFFQEQVFTPSERIQTPTELMRVLQQQGITHVVMTNALAGPDQVPAWFERLEPFLRTLGACVNENYLRVRWQSERYLLLEVNKTATQQTK